MAKHESVDAYHEPVADRARHEIDAVFGVTATINWSHLTWSVGKEPVNYLRAAYGHVTIGFRRGDAPRRLKGSGERMAHPRRRALDDIDVLLFADWFRTARAMAWSLPG